MAQETEMLQPIDHGAGAVLKGIMGQVQDEWLDISGNLDAWEGDPLAEFKLDAKMRRILITRWVADAWERLTTDPVYKDTLFKCFVTTGTLITADDTDDEKIQLMVGLPGGYSIPKVAVTMTYSLRKLHTLLHTLLMRSLPTHQLRSPLCLRSS